MDSYFHVCVYIIGDCVALIMENQPEQVGIWLGLSKIGVIIAQINTNLRTTPLLHCINIAKSKYIIYGSGLIDAINSIQSDLNKDIGLIVNMDNNETGIQFENSIVLNSALKSISDEPVTPPEKISNEGKQNLIVN